MTLSTDLSIKAVLSLYKILDEEPQWFALTVSAGEEEKKKHINLTIETINYNHFHKILEKCKTLNLKNTEMYGQDQ